MGFSGHPGGMRDEHQDDHGHEHHHDHGHQPDHRSHGVWGRLKHAAGLHSHSHDTTIDATLEGSREGMRTLWI